MDKGYQGAAEIIQAVPPKRKLRDGFTVLEKERRNRKVASDRIIVENDFWEQCALWIVMSSKYRWDEKFY